MNKTVIAAVAGALVAGVAIAGYQNFATPYAEVVSSTPITEKEPIYGDVLQADAVTQTVTGSREVCQDVAVERRQPERFGNKDGAVVGAVVGGLIGSQVGGGSGRKVATVAGAVGGGFAGAEIDRRHTGGQRYTTTEQQCHTVSEPREEVIGYDVRYTRDGQTLTTRVDEKPGPQILLGERDVIVGYEVQWKYEDQTGTIIMDEKPGDRLPMENGTIAIQDKDADTAAPPQG
jgi:uncharacterized protein YcfJ